MPKLSTAATCGLIFAVTMGQASAAAPTRAGVCADSPQAVLTVCVAADARGPYYEVYRGERQVITHARLGLVLEGFGNDPVNRVANARRNAVDQRWEQPWGEQRVIPDRHTELRVTLWARCEAHRTIRSQHPRIRRRPWLSIRVQPDRGRTRRCDCRRTHRVQPCRRLGRMVVSSAPIRPRRVSLPSRPPLRGEPGGNAVDAAVTRSLSIHPRGRTRRFRQHESAAHRGAHSEGRPHAVVRRRAGAQARTVRRHPGARC